MINKINFLFVTMFGIGKIKKIPGSFASLATTIFLFFLLHILKVSPDFIATGNIGCINQISSGISIPIIHTVEVIDWFTGGPKPQKLKNL